MDSLKIYYVGSFDPPHVGHYNTYRKAVKKFKSHVGIAICLNVFKKDSLLTLEQRRQACIKTFGTNDVLVYRDMDEIHEFAKSCDYIVRGTGRENDEANDCRILDRYGLGDIKDKIVNILIDSDYSGMSSTRIKKAINNHDREFCRKALDKGVYSDIFNCIY